MTSWNHLQCSLIDSKRSFTHPQVLPTQNFGCSTNDRACDGVRGTLVNAEVQRFMLFTWAHNLLQPFAMSCCHHTQQEGFLIMVNNQMQKKQTLKTITIVKEGRMKFYDCED